ncbi:MAG: hypothetical protein K2K30_03460 [Alistipes sp.]|nr:hypothetical protein [Alistipes sp.]
MKENTFAFFHQLSEKYQDSIDDTRIAEQFFNDFMALTEGQVNTDFIDGNYFDHIEKVEFNHEQGLMIIYFKMPEKDPVMRAMRKMVFSYDTYSMAIKLDSIRFAKTKGNDACIGVLIKGVSDNQKYIKKKIKEGKDNNHYRDAKTEFFSTEYLTLENGELTNTIGIDTPIIACWIIPKEFNISAYKSKIILYHINIKSLTDRLDRNLSDLHEKIQCAPCKEIKIEAIQAAGNSIRNIGESLLKLKVNYYYPRIKMSNNPYHSLLLGSLVNILNQNKLVTKEEKEFYGNFARKVNELSHASGIPAEEKDIIELSVQLRELLDSFRDIVDSDPIWMSEIPEKPALPSPKDFIHDNYLKWNFSQEIKECIKCISGKCRFRVKWDKSHTDFSSLFNQKGIYLCNDGTFKDTALQSEDCLKIYNRSEFIALVDAIYMKIEILCSERGFDIDSLKSEVNLVAELEKCGTPSHLFTLSEITDLMSIADDSQYNQLVIDEDGYPHIIQDVGRGRLYPVSQEFWAPNNWYVGPDSSLSDAEPSYQLCLEGWLSYLQTGRSFYSDLYPYIENEQALIDEIKGLMHNQTD